MGSMKKLQNKLLFISRVKSYKFIELDSRLQFS